MNFIQKVMEAVKPPTAVQQVGGDQLVGVTDADALQNKYFGKLSTKVTEQKRYEIIHDIDEMTNDGALADRVLEKLCSDATASPTQIEAPSRAKRVIDDMLKRIKWEELGAQYIYMWLAHGDLFLQKIYEESSQANKLGWIADVVRLPTETMVRNVNGKDQFYDYNTAYYQVPDIRYGISGQDAVPFHIGKILHARNDHVKSIHKPYGRSIYIAAIRFFNMAMMLLEDAAIGRHQSTQNMYIHYIGKHADLRVTDTMVKDYSQKAKAKLTENTTHYFVDGKNEIDLVGGTKARVSGVDDIRLVLSVLAVALDYPIDLLSAGVADDSGGEELFRKEVVLSRTVANIIKKTNNMILKPLIETELYLQGMKPKYRIVTQPVSFEDKAKKSKRQLSEVGQACLSRDSYFEENHPERLWPEEQKKIEEDAKFISEIAKKYPSYFSVGKKADKSTGEMGNPKDPESQQQRVTPGNKGSEERREKTDE